MIGKIILITISLVAVGVVYYLAHNTCVASHNTVFEAQVVDRTTNVIEVGFGSGVKNVCVVDLKPGHYVNYANDNSDLNFTRFYADQGVYNESCIYQVGDNVTIQPQTQTKAKILGFTSDITVVQGKPDTCW